MYYPPFGRTLRHSALALALAGCLASPGVWAQSVVGSIYGTAAPGSTVKIVNASTSFSRSMTVGADGSYALGSLPLGSYRVDEIENGQVVASHNATVIAAQSTLVNFAATPSSAQKLAAVQVTGVNLNGIDVNSVEVRTTFDAGQLRKLPVPKNIVAVSELAPTATGGEPAFGNLPSFGGASVAENSYYVNGFNITNLYDNLNFSQPPYWALQQLDVQTGGYGPQYGLSTGGVISAITKQGGNTWKGGASFEWDPRGLDEPAPNIYLKNGQIYQNDSQNLQSSARAAAWVGGPLIKDRLFLFAVVQQKRTYQDAYANNQVSSGGYARNTFRDPYWLVRLDWNINDNNILTYTGFNDTQHQVNGIYNAIYNPNNTVTRTNYLGSNYFTLGGQVNILKYTSYLTDNLTLNALIGDLTYDKHNYAVAQNGLVETYNGVVGDLNQPGCPVIIDARSSTAAGTTPPYPSCAFVPGGLLNTPNGKDHRREGRIDLDWRVGAHDLTGGFNVERWTSQSGQSYEGGALDYYLTDPNGNNYVQQYAFQTGAKVDVNQYAFYLNDKWQLTDRLLLSLGIRNDNFTNKNGLGQTYIRMRNIWQPRVGFAWDVHGDSSFKVYGNAGLYALPVAANVALRASSASLFQIQDFRYTGVDPVTGAPLGLTTDPTLPFAGPFTVNGENGSTPNASSYADKNLKPFEQEEFILGFQKRIDDWTFGVEGIRRQLLHAIDDTCDWRPFQAYALAHGIANAPAYAPSDMPGCFMFNPGRPLTINADLTGNGTFQPVTLTAAQIGEPKASRNYNALVFSFEKQWDNRWYLDGSYTWSQSYGNDEGLVDSDIQQADTGTTEAFDYPELMQGSYGFLPNDRRHVLKLYGAFRLNSEWEFGANYLLESGRPENCYGYNAAADSYIGYGNGYHYCFGHTVPRGSVGHTPWTWTLSPNVIYTPGWARGLTMELDIINLFNNTKPIAVNEFGEDSAGNSLVTTTYLIPRFYQTPRYWRFTVTYQFGE